MDSCRQIGGERVFVVSETAQEFLGEIFYRCGNYFQKSNSKTEKRLHRAVWSFYNGEIPIVSHIHHVDGDRENNQIENLRCIDKRQHGKIHGAERAEEITKIGLQYQHLTKEWHRSEEGREWHRLHYERNKDRLRRTHDAICSCCGRTYQAAESVKNMPNKYCSNACCSHARRKSGVDNVDRSCAKCGKVFSTNRYSPRKNCEECFPPRRKGRLLPNG